MTANKKGEIPSRNLPCQQVVGLFLASNKELGCRFRVHDER